MRRGYLELAAAEPERIRVVDSSLAPEVTEVAVRGALADLLPGLGRREPPA